MKYDITFNCENGTVRLLDCTRIQGQKDLQESAKDYDGIGLGRLKQIVIDVKA